MKKIIPAFCLVLSISFQTMGQIVTGHYHSKIAVPDDQEFFVQTDSLYIDTLILGNNSKLKFLFTRTKMIVENAFIGNSCLWDATGKAGAHGTLNLPNGEDGEDGKNLVLVIVFRELKHLLIRTDGGKGGDGVHASTGRTIRVDGGNAGDGGDGGHLELHYSSIGFLPRFNEEREHSISFSYSGGSAGHSGFGRKDVRARPVSEKEYYHTAGGTLVRSEATSAPTPNGSNGLAGNQGINGQLVLKRFD